MKAIDLFVGLLVCTGIQAQTHLPDSVPVDSLRTVRLREVVKVAKRYNKLESPAMGLTLLDAGAIKRVPTLFGEPDLIKALQLQPGVSPGVEGFAGMLVRGGNQDENMFLIDGNPIYPVNHLGGLFSPFNMEAIENTQFYKAAFPARYGGRLSSVTAITMKSGDKETYHGNFTIGLTSANLSFSGPLVKNRTTFFASVRRSWLELVSVPALAIINATKKDAGEKKIAGYSFTDFNLKLEHDMRRWGTLAFLTYYGHDRMKVGEEQFSTDEKLPYRHHNENRLKWGNVLTALQWQLPINDQFRYDMNASFTRYVSGFKKETETVWGTEGDDNYESTRFYKDVTNYINDFSVNASLAYYPTEAATLRLGANYTRHRFSPEKLYQETSDNPAGNVTSGSDLPADEWNAYLEGDIRLLPQLSLNAGLRASFFRVGTKLYPVWEPRVSANYQISPVVSVKAGYARMSQFVQQVSDNYISLPTDYWMPITEEFEPLSSDQLSVGGYFSLNDRFLFSVEGYYKWMRNLLEYRDGYKNLPADTRWSDKLASGEGRAYGMDFQAEGSWGKLSGYLGYGLLWSDRLFPELNRGRRFPSKYDNRHKLTLSLTYALSKRVELNGGWTYMTGNRVTLALENYQYPEGYPTTEVPTLPDSYYGMLNYFEGRNNIRLPAYHRLDVGINIFCPRKNGHMGIWNVSLYNAYSRMNPIMIEKNDDIQTTEGKPLNPRFRTLAIFPIIPSFSYTYKF